MPYARCTFFNQMSTPSFAYLARRMQGVHFLTKCQPLVSDELARRMQGVHFLTKCQPPHAEVIQVIRG